MKVLVTGAGALLGQGIIRSLLESTLEVEVIACDPSPLSAGLYWAKKRHLLPFASSPDFIPRLDEVLALERPDAVLVGTDVELLALAEHRAALEAKHHTHVIVSSPRVVRIADDKLLTYEFMRANGFDPPETAVAGEHGALVAKLGFPLIVKPRVGARSVGVHVVRNEAELDRALTSVEGAIVQELLATDSDEYTAGAIGFDGTCLATIVMRRDLRDGNTYRAFVDHHPELSEVVRAMTEKLDPYGPVNFQFRLDRGRVRVFEINGRFSGTTPLRMRAGFNEVEMVLRHVVLGEPIAQPTIEPMTILRHWSETVVRNDELVR